MSDEELRRDPEIARAIEGIAVPGYEPGFWDRLDARLEHEVAPEAVPQPPHVAVPATIDLPSVVPLPARRREQRRSLVVLGVAAAAILAILAVRLGTSDPDDDLRIAGDGGTPQVAPDDGTTTPDGPPERDGASREGDADGAAAADQATDEPRADGSEITVFSSSSLPGGGEGAATSPRALATPAAPRSAEEAFLEWAAAIDRGDAEAAIALTGPRTIRYYEALGADLEGVMDESQETWGVWADPDGRRIQPVELGQVDGERAVGLVLERPAPDPDDADGLAVDGVPVVKGEDGWKVEPAAFDPKRDGRIEVIAPAPGPNGFQDLPKGAAIRIAAQRTGSYYLNLDLSQSARIPASDAVDGEITWNPGGQRSDIVHLLVVAHLDAGQVVMLAQTFETASA